MHGADHQLRTEHDVARDLLNAVAGARNGRRILRLLAKLLQIVAGAERASGAGQDDHAGGRIVLGVFQGRVQVTEQLAADGVEPLGSIQGDDADGTLEGVIDVSHRWFSLLAGATGLARPRSAALRSMLADAS